MEFSHFLSSYYPDPRYGGRRLFADMVEQAITAERLGYRSVTIPEHHLINILLTPSPLQMAVKVASVTERLDLVTSVAVLPIRDMRVFAGEVAQADILTDGRLVLGVGRGAFGYEMGRLGSPIEDSREKFDESLDVLVALLTREDVSWSGKYYEFEPLTVMPRPLTRPRPRMMIASVSPEGISAMTRRGFDIQTTPLSGDDELFMRQVGAHKEAKAQMGAAGERLRIMASRIVYCARDAADARDKIERAYDYYKRFYNVRERNPAVVARGLIEPLPFRQTVEELAANLVVCPPAEMVDRLAPYQEAGIDEFILSSNLGQPQEEHIEAMERFAAQVMPCFTGGREAEVRGTVA